MATLSSERLTLVRQHLAAHKPVVDWDKPTINSATQAVEDLLDGLGFNAASFVSVVITNHPRAQAVKQALDAGQIPAAIVPIAEDWLSAHLLTSVTRTIADTGSWVQDNRVALGTAIAAMPGAVREELIREVLLVRIRAVL